MQVITQQQMSDMIGLCSAIDEMCSRMEHHLCVSHIDAYNVGYTMSIPRVGYNSSQACVFTKICFCLSKRSSFKVTVWVRKLSNAHYSTAILIRGRGDRGPNIRKINANTPYYSD